MTLTTHEMRTEWAAYECNSKGWETISFLNRAPVKVIDLWVPFWLEAEKRLYAAGYGDAALVGSYNCRNIAGSTRRSLHAYRLAVDIDPHLNGRYRGEPFSEGKITASQVATVEAIRTNSGEQAFYSGVWFTTVFDQPAPDPMHIQGATTIEAIKTGVAMFDHFQIGEEYPEWEPITWLLFILSGGTIDANADSSQIQPVLGKTNVRLVTDSDFDKIVAFTGLTPFNGNQLKLEGLYRWGKEIAALQQFAFIDH